MPVGRYLATDSGDAFRRFGSSIGDIGSAIASYEDRRKARELQRMREQRYRDQEDRLRARQTFSFAEALADEPDPVARGVLSRTIPSDAREDIGYTPIPGTSIQGSDMLVSPPTAPGVEPGPTNIRTPSRPAVERDPFAGTDPDDVRRITYRGAELPEDEYLDLRRRESEAAYSGAPRGGGSSGSPPTRTEVEAVIEPILWREGYGGIRKPLIPPEQISFLTAQVLDGELTLTQAQEVARDMLEMYPDYGAPADTTNMLGPRQQEEDEGPGFWGTVGSWFGIGDDEPEPEPTVRMPWPRPDEFRDRRPEGMRGAPVEPDPMAPESTRAPRGSLAGPEPDGPLDSARQAKVDELIQRGYSDSDIAAALAEELGIDEAEALDIVEGRRTAPRLGPR
ncbi:MAG: hypothetical protein ACODAA_05425 [Gemmatimonadota bacterium]